MVNINFLRTTAVTRDLGFSHQLKLGFVFESSVFNRKIRHTFPKPRVAAKRYASAIRPEILRKFVS